MEKVKELELSAYEISKGTTLTEAGIARIIKKVAKNPHENSLNQILEFLESKVLGTNIDKENEDPEEVHNSNSGNDLMKYAKCLEYSNKLIREIVRLQGLLRDNNIEFDNFFENERK
ncbi:hypothetical protein [Flavobacterium sp. FlaQc-28]|uniref:hypothetical protein n=1 Tax=Flavobacterium sp. FlaQc-28 TaxID=3374178 RepID=UPI00375744EB